MWLRHFEVPSNYLLCSLLILFKYLTHCTLNNLHCLYIYILYYIFNFKYIFITFWSDLRFSLYLSFIQLFYIKEKYQQQYFVEKHFVFLMCSSRTFVSSFLFLLILRKTLKMQCFIFSYLQADKIFLKLITFRLHFEKEVFLFFGAHFVTFEIKMSDKTLLTQLYLQCYGDISICVYIYITPF